LNIRQLFDEFECDYLVIDVKGLGIGVVDAIMSDIYDANTGITYGALSCCNNEVMAARCAVPNAPKKIWAIQGSSEFNSMCALGLREEFKQGSIRLLVSEYDSDVELKSIKNYGSLNPEELVMLKLPYIHTTLLINELINLEYEVKNNVVRVKEKSNMRKDRYSSLSYNIYVAKTIEKELQQQSSKKLTNSMALVWKAPKISNNYNKKRR
jgi:hypothetical protein